MVKVHLHFVGLVLLEAVLLGQGGFFVGYVRKSYEY